MSKKDNPPWLKKANEGQIPFKDDAIPVSAATENDPYKYIFEISETESTDDNIIECRAGLAGIEKRSRHVIVPHSLYDEIARVSEGTSFNLVVVAALEFTLKTAKEKNIKFVVKQAPK